MHDICRATRKHYSSEEKILIVLEGKMILSDLKIFMAELIIKENSQC